MIQNQTSVGYNDHWIGFIHFISKSDQMIIKWIEVKDKDSNDMERSSIAFLFFIFRFIASKFKGLDIWQR